MHVRGTLCRLRSRLGLPTLVLVVGCRPMLTLDAAEEGTPTMTASGSTGPRPVYDVPMLDTFTVNGNADEWGDDGLRVHGRGHPRRQGALRPGRRAHRQRPGDGRGWLLRLGSVVESAGRVEALDMTMAYPEAVCLRKQMAKTLTDKEIADVDVFDITKVEGSWRFGSIDQPPDVFQRRLEGGVITGAESVANSVFLSTSTGHAR